MYTTYRYLTQPIARSAYTTALVSFSKFKSSKSESEHDTWYTNNALHRQLTSCKQECIIVLNRCITKPYFQTLRDLSLKNHQPRNPAHTTIHHRATPNLHALLWMHSVANRQSLDCTPEVRLPLLLKWNLNWHHFLCLSRLP